MKSWTIASVLISCTNVVESIDQKTNNPTDPFQSSPSTSKLSNFSKNLINVHLLLVLTAHSPPLPDSQKQRKSAKFFSTDESKPSDNQHVIIEPHIIALAQIDPSFLPLTLSLLTLLPTQEYPISQIDFRAGFITAPLQLIYPLYSLSKP